jgi:hypothetical protein
VTFVMTQDQLSALKSLVCQLVRLESMRPSPGDTIH